MENRTVLKIKLKIDEDHAAELATLASLCRRGRNAGSLNWLLRQNGLPETAKQSERLCKHKKHADKPKGESSRIYHAIRDATPELTATVHSMLANQINSFLSSRLDWREGKNEDGKRPKRADAILRYDARPPYFTAVEIPVRAREAMLRYGDISTLTCRVALAGIIALKISTASLPGGIKRKLMLLSAGTLKMADSKLLERDGDWYWFVTITEEREPLRSERIAVLNATVPTAETVGYQDRPFTLSTPDSSQPRWLGDSRYILAQTARIETARKDTGRRYRCRNGAGHGRAKPAAAMSAWARKQSAIDDEFRRKLIVFIGSEAERHGCGKVIYHEPSLPARTKCWFDVRGIRWNWTRFVCDLENSLARRGITLEKKIRRIKELIEA